MSSVVVLFARADSIYKTMPDCDVWDIERDALKWQGGAPIVAHPPCRAWGALSHMANPRPGERELAMWAVDRIREYGGVLEHPRASRLWPEYNLPKPGLRDEFGGFSILIHQSWFGHKAEKQTLLYIAGCEPENLPTWSMSLVPPTHVIGAHRFPKGHPQYRPEVTKAEREHTPTSLAKWLVEVAKLCRNPGLDLV